MMARLIYHYKKIRVCLLLGSIRKRYYKGLTGLKLLLRKVLTFNEKLYAVKVTIKGYISEKEKYVRGHMKTNVM